jgi:hypothetical protein
MVFRKAFTRKGLGQMTQEYTLAVASPEDILHKPFLRKQALHQRNGKCANATLCDGPQTWYL